MQELNEEYHELRAKKFRSPIEEIRLGELRRLIHEESFARQRLQSIASLYPNGINPTSILFVQHRCGHILSYRGQSLIDIAGCKLGYIEDKTCCFCEWRNLGVVLEGCWK